MLKKVIAATLAALLILAQAPYVGAASDASVGGTVVAKFSLATAVANTSAFLTTATVWSNTTFTMTAQPDIPRQIVITTAAGTDTTGTMTLNGTNGDGLLISETFNVTQPNNSFTTVNNFKTITNLVVAGTNPVTTPTLGVGSTSSWPYVFPLLCGVAAPEAVLDNGDCIYTWSKAFLRVKTTGSSTTLVSNTASSGALTVVGVGDVLVIGVPMILNSAGNYVVPATGSPQAQTPPAVPAAGLPATNLPQPGPVSGFTPAAGSGTVGGVYGTVLREFVVTAKASNDSITLDQAVNLDPTLFPNGQSYYYRNQKLSDTANAGWVNVRGMDVKTFLAVTSAASGVGGLNFKVECQDLGADQTTPLNTPNSNTRAVIVTNSGAVKNISSFPDQEIVNLNLVEYDRCRVGFQWATSGTSSNIDVYFRGVRRSN